LLEKFDLCLLRDRRYDKVEHLLVKVIKTRKRMLGQKYSDTLTSIANLASTYKIKNDGRRLKN